MNGNFQRYLPEMETVEGWLSQTTACVTHEMLILQTNASIKGNVAEIGVHHGRYFIVLGCSLAPGERAIAIDLFEDQHQNIDGSGAGDMSALKKNVARFLPPDVVTPIRANSTALQSCDITRHGDLRFLSIDGGHTTEITLSDLRLAQSTLAEGGLVALYDVLNQHWPGVISGLTEYLASGEADLLVPFAIVPNKVYLARRAYIQFYRDGLRRISPSLLKSVEFLGYPVDVYTEWSEYQIDQDKLLEKLQSEKSEMLEELVRLRTEMAILRNSKRIKLANLVADGIYRAFRR